MESKIYNQKGKETGSISLPESIFDLSWNSDLVHQIILAMQANARTPVAHTKDRGDVSGGGKKPWKQKGTGRARHGSTRSPIWVGGGVAHGPRNTKDYSQKINSGMKNKALLTIISKKFKDGEILFVDDLKTENNKTKEAKEILLSLSKIKGFEKIVSKKKNSTLLALSGGNKEKGRAFQNFSNIQVEEVRNINPISILSNKYLLVEDPENFVKGLQSKVKSKAKIK